MDESGDHFGECATIVARLTSLYGIPDGELNAGISRLPNSVYELTLVPINDFQLAKKWSFIRISMEKNRKKIGDEIRKTYCFGQKHFITGQMVCAK